MDFFGDYFEILTGVGTIIGAVGGWVVSKVIPYCTKRSIRKCLSLEKKECTIILVAACISTIGHTLQYLLIDYAIFLNIQVI